MKEKLEIEIKNMMYHYFEDNVKEYVRKNVDTFSIEYRFKGGSGAVVSLWELLTKLIKHLDLELRVTPEKIELVKLDKAQKK